MIGRVLAVSLLAASGCAAPLFVGQTGRVTPKGSWRAEVGYGLNVSTSAIDLVKDAKSAVDRARAGETTCTHPDGQSGYCYDEALVRPIVDAAYKLALVSPFSSYSEVSVRYGLLDGVDVGAHLGTGAYRLDVGWQVFGDSDPLASSWAGTVYAGWNKDSTGIVGDVLEMVKGDASRNDYDLLFVVGRQFGEVGRFFVGGRYMLSSWKLELVPDLPIVYDSGQVQETFLGTDSSGYLHQFGGVVGGAVGWKHVFVGGELAIVRYQGSARLFFEDHAITGFNLVPSLFLYGQY